MSAAFGMMLPAEIAVGDTTIITDTNVSLDDFTSAYNAGTTYTAGQYCYVQSTGMRYRSVQGSNLNHNPASDDGTWWVEYGAMTRWRPFDDKIGSYASRTTSLYYELTADKWRNSIALFNLIATSVRIQIVNQSATEIYDETFNLVDKSDIRDFLSFLRWEPTYAQTFFKTGLPIDAGYAVTITIAGASGDTVQVGTIVLGRAVQLGFAAGEGTDIGYEDFSQITTNEFGEREIVERDYADDATFAVYIQNNDEARVRRLLTQRRAKPTVFWTGPDHDQKGTTTLGIPQRPRVPIRADSYSLMQLPILGLT